MPHNLKLTFNERQWKTLKSMANARHTSPGRLIKKRMLEEKNWKRGLEISESILVNPEELRAYPVEKKIGSDQNETLDTAGRIPWTSAGTITIEREMDKVLRSNDPPSTLDPVELWAPSHPEDRLASYEKTDCSFCDNSGLVWLNGKQVECPRCSA